MTGTYSVAVWDGILARLIAVTYLEEGVMSDDTDVIVGALGRELVLDLAPEELPLYPSTGSARGETSANQLC